MIQTFIDGKVDAVLAFPPQPQQLRAKKIGRVIITRRRTVRGTSISAAWSAARKEFVSQTRSPPSVRCARSSRPPTSARGTPSAPPATWSAKGLRAALRPGARGAEVPRPTTRWRTYDPEDSLRFYGVRLHEVG